MTHRSLDFYGTEIMCEVRGGVFRSVLKRVGVGATLRVSAAHRMTGSRVNGAEVVVADCARLPRIRPPSSQAHDDRLVVPTHRQQLHRHAIARISQPVQRTLAGRTRLVVRFVDTA